MGQLACFLKRRKRTRKKAKRISRSRRKDFSLTRNVAIEWKHITYQLVRIFFVSCWEKVNPVQDCCCSPLLEMWMAFPDWRQQSCPPVFSVSLMPAFAICAIDTFKKNWSTNFILKKRHSKQLKPDWTTQVGLILKTTMQIHTWFER